MDKILSFIRLRSNWLVLFILIILKYAYYGYSYYPVRDDNNAYGIFRLYDNVFKDVILHYKTYTVRPVVALLDPYFWTKLWDNLGLALLIITFVHFLSCILIYKILKANNLNTGLGVMVIFSLMPLGSEATYWINASTRIVVGLFFVVLSLYLLCIYFKNQNNSRYGYFILGAFFIIHLISLGFYEQLIVLSLFATFPLFALNWKRIKRKWIAVLPAINFCLITIWYKAFSGSGMAANRGMLVNSDYLEHTKKIIKSIFHIWKVALGELYNTGFIKGIRIITGDGNYLFFSLAVVLSITVAFIYIKEKGDASCKTSVIKILLGVFLFIVPFIPFFVLDTVTVFKRNIFLSFIGLGLVFEALLGVLSRNAVLNIFRGFIVGMLVFVFLTANVYELYYYRQLGQIDREITGKISMIKESAGYLNGEKNLILFNAKAMYIQTYADRSPNCTNADWALTGALEANNGIAGLKLAYPVFNEYNMPLLKDIIKSSVLLGIDDARNIYPLKIEEEEKDLVILATYSGSEFGQIEILPGNHIIFHSSLKT